MRWCYIFNCVYYVSGIYRPKLWLDLNDYEHLIWPRLLLYYMWLITVNYQTIFIGLTCFEFLPLQPCTFTHKLSIFLGIRLQLVSEVGSVDIKHHNHGKRSYCPFIGRRWFRSGLTIVAVWRSQHGCWCQKPLVMPGSYNGSTSLIECLSHFMLVTQVSRWTSQETALYLAVSLSGPPRCLLSGVDLEAADVLERLIAALERRFQPRDQEAIYRTQFKARWQQKGESISQLSDSVEQLVRQAYPSADSETWLFHGRTGPQQPSPLGASVQANLLPSGSRRCAARWGLFPGGRRVWDPPPAYYGWPGECGGTIIGACSRAAIACCIRS